MAINVNDIIGKGFVFNVSAETIIEPTPTTTIGAFIGCANSGPTNTPTLITGGLREFYSVFGTEPANVNTVQDFGWYAAEHHFRKSSIGYFTRLADTSAGNLETSSILIENPSTEGILTGTVIIPSGGINPQTSQTYTATLGKSDGTTVTTANITIPAAEAAIIDGQTPVGYGTPYGFSSGHSMDITVTENGTPFVGTIQPIVSQGSDIDATVTYFNSLISAVPTLTGKVEAYKNGSNALSLRTILKGTGAIIALSNITGTRLATPGGIFRSYASSDTGLSVTRSSLITAFDSAANTALGTTGISYLTFNGSNRAVITNNATVGEDSTVAVSGAGATTLFGASPVISTGSVDQPIGTLTAVYAGTEGNSIGIKFTGNLEDGNQATIYYQGKAITTISNFVFDPTSNDYIGKMIADDFFANPIVAWSRESSDFIDIDPITDTIIYLEGGKSGGMNSDEDYPTQIEVITEINKYGNVDLYSIDIICYPAGGASYGDIEAVQNALQTVCEDRQDCFAIIDPPTNITNTTNLLNWQNGNYAPYRSNRIDSMYLVTYYPNLKVRFAGNRVATVSPSVRAVGTITQSHNIANGLKFTAPAGQQRAVIDGNIVGLSKDLSKTEKDLMYADTYNGRINPISFSLATGYFLDGNKTTQFANNSLRRINTMATVLYIKKRIQTITPRFFYEPSSPTTWAAFQAELAAIMKFLEEKNAIEPESDTLNGWSVICDESNNTPEVTNRNGMVAQISYVGIKAIERIKISAEIREKKSSVSISV
jgi:hypothetical protein